MHTVALGSLRVLPRRSRDFLDSGIGVALILNLGVLSVQNDQSWDSEAGKCTDHSASSPRTSGI